MWNNALSLDLNIVRVSYSKEKRICRKMNNLSYDDPSLDSLDPSLSLNDPSDIDTALLNDIDGKKSCLSQFLNLPVHILP